MPESRTLLLQTVSLRFVSIAAFGACIGILGRGPGRLDKAPRNGWGLRLGAHVARCEVVHIAESQLDNRCI